MRLYSLVQGSSFVHCTDPDTDGAALVVGWGQEYLAQLQREYDGRPFVGEELWAGRVGRAVRGSGTLRIVALLHTIPPPGPRRRPATVAVSCGALVVVGVLYLVLTALSLSMMDGVKERFIAAAQNIEGTPDSAIEKSVTFFTIGTVAGTVMGLALTVVTVVLALFNLRGKNASRILTWVVCGGFALCGLCSLRFGVVDITSRAPDLLEAFDAAYPDWYLPTTTTLTICQVILMIGVAVLLALPASNTFFRKTPPAAPPPNFPPTPSPYPGI